MKQLKIILQGGGTRCAYQMAFLNKIIHSDTFKNNFNIDSVYGTSFGALVGYFYCIGKLNILNDFFLSINEDSLKPHFDFWGYGSYLKRIPLVGNFFRTTMDVVWLLKSVMHKSLYDQSHGFNDLFKNNEQQNEQIKEQLKKFNCCVYNITKQKIEYINGSHPLIIEYILASASLWIVFKPKLIPQLKSECICDETCLCPKNDTTGNDLCTCTIDTHKFNEYMDGGILKPIPYEHDETFDGKYLILTTKDIERINNKKFMFNNSGEHLFEYLDNIITFLVEYHQHIDLKYINKDWHTKDNIYLINYKPKSDDPTILNQTIIKEYITDGKLLATEFLNKLENEIN